VRFLLDHDVPAEVARVLRHWGHDALVLSETLAVTSSDRDIFQYAQQRELTIVSCNRAHFLALAEQAVQAQQAFAGLIVLIRRRTRQAECAHLLTLLRRAGESGLSGNINFA
jgi:predicted nuclease of predicted toxin-antitoxin system